MDVTKQTPKFEYLVLAKKKTYTPLKFYFFQNRQVECFYVNTNDRKKKSLREFRHPPQEKKGTFLFTSTFAFVIHETPKAHLASFKRQFNYLLFI